MVAWGENEAGQSTVPAGLSGVTAISAGNRHSLALKGSYVFTGFAAPVANPPTLNIANAGQSIPLKFRVTDSSGAPVTNLSTVSVTAAPYACSGGAAGPAVEEDAAGSSGLQNLGDGYYQFNWKTPKGYALSCRMLVLDIGDGVAHSALFHFRK